MGGSEYRNRLWRVMTHMEATGAYGKEISQTFSCINTPKFSNLVILHTYPPMKMEQTECPETSAYKIQTPGNYPEESIQHSEQGESLKSRIHQIWHPNDLHFFSPPKDALHERHFITDWKVKGDGA
jgi:hypothetical protein